MPVKCASEKGNISLNQMLIGIPNVEFTFVLLGQFPFLSSDHSLQLWNDVV